MPLTRISHVIYAYCIMCLSQTEIAVDAFLSKQMRDYRVETHSRIYSTKTRDYLCNVVHALVSHPHIFFFFGEFADCHLCIPS